MAEYLFVRYVLAHVGALDAFAIAVYVNVLHRNALSLCRSEWYCSCCEIARVLTKKKYNNRWLYCAICADRGRSLYVKVIVTLTCA